MRNHWFRDATEKIEFENLVDVYGLGAHYNLELGVPEVEDVGI